MANYLTREEMYNYARLSDLMRVSDTAVSTARETERLRYEVGLIVDKDANTRNSVECRFDIIENELMQIKAVLSELQMTLRTLGLDDMTRNIGDIDLLLT